MTDDWWNTRREQTRSEATYRGIVADLRSAGFADGWILEWLCSANGRLANGASPLDLLATDPDAVRRAADAVIAGPP